MFSHEKFICLLLATVICPLFLEENKKAAHTSQINRKLFCVFPGKIKQTALYYCIYSEGRDVGEKALMCEALLSVLSIQSGSSLGYHILRNRSQEKFYNITQHGWKGSFHS